MDEHTQNEEDTTSHENHSVKDENHKGSLTDTSNREEKKNDGEEDLEYDADDDLGLMTVQQAKELDDDQLDCWTALRLKTIRLIDSKYFEDATICVIMASSFALKPEDHDLEQWPMLQDLLYYIDRIIPTIFIVEMLLKWLALGFKKYFTNAWCWLDFIIVMLSLINMAAVRAGVADIPAFRSIRCLRAVRPLFEKFTQIFRSIYIQLRARR